MTTESYCWEGRGQQYLHSAKQSLPAKLQRRMLQLLGRVFPCGLRSYRIGRASSSACNLCGCVETPSHILCSCKPLQDIVTASHDKIWKRLFEFLNVSLPDWKFHFDKAIGKFDLLELTRPFTGSVSKKKPDGAAQRMSQNECFLLEFTRTTDFWPTSLDASRVRKEDKEGYVEMLAGLCDRLPGWNVQLLTFVLGDRGLFDEKTWKLNLDSLCLTLSQQKNFVRLAQTGAYEVVEDILQVRSALLHALHH